MAGHNYDKPRPRAQRLKEDQELMILSRKGIPLKDLAHIYGLNIGGVHAAVTRVEEHYLAWGFKLPPKAPRL